MFDQHKGYTTLFSSIITKCRHGWLYMVLDKVRRPREYLSAKNTGRSKRCSVIFAVTEGIF